MSFPSIEPLRSNGASFQHFGALLGNTSKGPYDFQVTLPVSCERISRAIAFKRWVYDVCRERGFGHQVEAEELIHIVQLQFVSNSRL